MALEDIVSVSITASTASPTRAGFGTMLVAAQKVPAGFTNRVRKYSDLAGMTSDGFLTSDPAYKCAQKYFSANPRPKAIKVGRRANKTTQALKLKCLSAVAGDVYTVTLVSSLGVSTVITRTVPGSSNVNAEATAIAALIAAVTGFTGTTASTDTISIVSSVGVGSLVALRSWSSTFLLTDQSADPGIAADLAAILLEDSDWYGLQLDSQSENELNAAAAWVESTPNKLHIATSSDGTILDSAVTTDVASDFKAAAYKSSGLIYNGNATDGYSGAAWMGQRFVDAPGSDTWNLKTLSGVSADSLTATQRANALAKLCNVYVPTSGINITQLGQVASGEFIDVRRFIDWLTSEIKVRVFSKLANARKIPYTDAGVDAVVSIIQGALRDGVDAGGLAASPAPVVTAPLVADVDSVSKAARLLPNITFTGTLAGAIHSTTITGTVSV